MMETLDEKEQLVHSKTSAECVPSPANKVPRQPATTEEQPGITVTSNREL